VGSFAIGGHRFVRLVADSAMGNAIRTGFYEVLLDGPVQVLAKRAKRLQEHIVNPNVDVQFTGTDRLFLRKDGICYPINRKSAALRVFSARSKEMQSYLKANKLSFKNDQFESSIALLASYYSQLSK